MHDVLLPALVTVLADGEGSTAIESTLITVIGAVVVAAIGLLTAVLRREPRAVPPAPQPDPLSGPPETVIQMLQRSAERAETRAIASDRSRARAEARVDQLEAFCFRHGLNPADAYRRPAPEERT